MGDYSYRSGRRVATTRELDGEQQKFCHKCNTFKAFASFGAKRQSKSNVSSWCKSCRVVDTAEWRKRKGRWVSPLVGRVQRLVSHICRSGSTLRSADLHALYEQQNGKCYYTGVEMVLMSTKKNDLRSMSVDRVDSSKGYENGNVVLCCLGMNLLKGRHSADEMFSNLEAFYLGAKHRNAHAGWD